MRRFLLLLLACAMPVAAQEIHRDDFVKRQSDGILIQEPKPRQPHFWRRLISSIT